MQDWRKHAAKLKKGGLSVSAARIARHGSRSPAAQEVQRQLSAGETSKRILKIEWSHRKRVRDARGRFKKGARGQFRGAFRIF